MDDRAQEMRKELEKLTGIPAAERQRKAFEIVVATLMKTFCLKPDEIAVLILSEDRDMLRFAYPPELAAGGSNAFPVRFPSVAGRVVASGESLLSNRCSRSRTWLFTSGYPCRVWRRRRSRSSWRFLCEGRRASCWGSSRSVDAGRRRARRGRISCPRNYSSSSAWPRPPRRPCGRCRTNGG